MNSVTLGFIPRLKNITTFWIYLLIAFQQIVYITENKKKKQKSYVVEIRVIIQSRNVEGLLIILYT